MHCCIFATGEEKNPIVLRRLETYMNVKILCAFKWLQMEFTLNKASSEFIQTAD